MIRSMLLKAKHDRAEGADRADLSEPAQPVPALSPDTIRLYLLLFTTNSLLYWWVYSSIPLRVEWYDEWMYERSQVTRTNAWIGSVRKCDEIDLKRSGHWFSSWQMPWDGERLSQESTGYPAKEFSEVKSELSEGKGEANRGWGCENLMHCFDADAVWGRFSKAFERTSETILLLLLAHNFRQFSSLLYLLWLLKINQILLCFLCSSLRALSSME